ncbi:Stage III sporulation protein J [Aedoeadaptatus ivorii]|uniref:Stage III sporulation protein J n=1 Tax=Aedoeadaptatus ivorii TaxID=54006 RepID=A0A448V3M9_9FIRM|nr:YidC/Oxa1 family membrane protein insertase [Peptoniphilus ivorii]MDQ0508420.1 YidC/Oxa1 family membrane protein insertase [Peptoniphilus ivorii]VEJ36387.1 Stage III sporulation protein J [Peptoniphilus ivorii]
MINFLAGLLGTLLRGVYDFVSAMGAEPKAISFYAIAIVLTTLLFRFALLPLNIMQTRNQLKMAKLEPERQKLQKKYGNDPQLLAQKQQQLYKEAEFNPLSGCLPMLVQFPVLIAFYRIFQFPTKFAFQDAGFYDAIQKNFFFIQSLDHPDPTGLALPIVAAFFTWLSTYIVQKNNKAPSTESSEQMMRTMSIMMPLMILIFARRMAAGLVLYWITGSIFSILQQMISNKVVEKEAEA